MCNIIVLRLQIKIFFEETLFLYLIFLVAFMLFLICTLKIDLGLLFSNQSKQDVMKAVLFLMCILIVTGNIVASSFASS